MVNDLTSLFEEAKRREPMWTEQRRVYVVLQILFKVQQAVDMRDNEDWHWIVKGKEVLSFLRVDFPLGIIHKEYSAVLRPVLETNDVVTLTVSDWDSTEYSLKPSAIPQLFPYWHSDFVSPTFFSISDLVYATV